MFNEKDLPRLIIATPIIAVSLFALLIIYFFVNTQYSNFHEESIELEKEYILRQKNILKNENKKVLDYINYHREIELKRAYDKFRALSKSGVKISNETIDKYEEEILEKLKIQVIDWIESVRYETNGYVWVHDTSHHLVAHPFRRSSIGHDDTNNTDATGAKIFQKFINIAKQNEEGGFLEYYWAKPEFEAPRKKIGFLALDKEWGWVIGTGLYVDDIESSIYEKKLKLERKIDKYVRIILLIAFSLMILVGLVSYLISKNIVRVFTSYRENVSKKEEALKDFNKILRIRINEALREAKKKDQALLHQSRLAQMGEMISMIAHQWRQPLCEISGIFMELETAAKFDKADKDFIQRESKDGNKLISYMSKTIDDFRDFFKPAKTKKVFSLKEACEEAISLASASLKSENIILDLHVKEELHTSGYKSEFAQVVLNLILNAKDVLIQRAILKPTIVVIIDAEDDKAVVIVSDNGGGIKEDIIQKIYDPYFSTKKSAGTGLGLYMSKMIIEEKMSGELSVSNKNGGARFVVRVLHV
ncbi:sensor histidine kinase [Sulfurospirillum arcachonense]|uniref:sensor histidine kinase n=1 Tax=Sulfurospirillum arcachonense TaxID=57666 RepID=UPI00046A7B60|nr:cache domain-containing protein [Sulfurospirillum arcachonense]